jgi:hypothetical protein
MVFDQVSSSHPLNAAVLRRSPSLPQKGGRDWKFGYWGDYGNEIIIFASRYIMMKSG